MGGLEHLQDVANIGRNGKEGSHLTFDLMAEDGIEVAEYLCRRLRTEQVILVGHSEGSVVGVKMAQRRPDLFCAYVGTGQITDMARNEAESYPRALQRARTSGSTKALRELEKAGPPPYPLARTWLTSLAQEYFAVVEAPTKDLVLLPGGGHCAVLMQPGTFLAELRARIIVAEAVERGGADRP